MQMPYEVEMIKWIDSCQATDGWHDLENNTIQPSYVYSCGKIIKETDHYVVIVAHYSPKDPDSDTTIESACGEMAIPKCAIIERYKLRA